MVHIAHTFLPSQTSAASSHSRMIVAALGLLALATGMALNLSLGTQVLSGGALVSLVVAPVVEELFFRGVVHEDLLRRGMNALSAIAIVSCLFAVAHVWGSSAGHALATALPAFFIGVVFHATRRYGLFAALIAAVLLHSLFNALWRYGFAENVLNYAPWLV
jgi:membrane protease YdiL (CAAX protease family)